MLRRMNEGDVYLHNFQRQCREIVRLRGLREELRRVVIECKQAADAGDEKRARSLLRQADRIRVELER